MSKSFILALVAFLSVCVPSLSCSDGGPIPLIPGIHVFEPKQRAILAWNGDEEIILLSTDLKASRQSKVLEIFPMPAEPLIKKGSIEAFQKVTNLINGKLRARQMLIRRLRAGMVVGGPGNVGSIDESPAGKVIFHEKIGSHDLTVANVIKKESFVKWAEDIMKSQGADNPTIPEPAQKIVSQYLEEGFSWFVFDIVELDKTQKTKDAILFRFPSKSLFYPLKISSIAKGYSLIDLVVISRNLLVNFKGYPVSQLRTLYEPLDIDSSELEPVDKEISKLFGSNRLKLRTWCIEGELASFNNDLWASGAKVEQGTFMGDGGGEPTQPDNTPLVLKLAYLGHLDKALELVREGARIDELGTGWKLLEIAVKNKDLESATFLIDRGVDPGTASGRKRHDSSGPKVSPLENAALQGDMPMIHLLIKKGAIVNLSAFQGAIRGRRLDIVTFLLDSDSEVGKDRVLIEMARAGYVEGVILLLEKGADPNSSIIESNKRVGVSGFAVASGSLDAVKLLLEKGADPNHGSPVAKAAEKARIDMVHALIAKGADLQPLQDVVIWLIQQGKAEEIRKLLEGGIPVDRNKALDSAASYGRVAICQLLVEHGADVNKGAPLVWAASSGNMETVIFFLDKGVDVHKKDAFGRTALRCADSGAFTKIRELLVRGGAKE